MKKFFYIPILFCFSFSSMAQPVSTHYEIKDNKKIFTLSNNIVTESVIIANDILQGDELTGNKEWLAEYNNHNHNVYTDGNYALQMMWTDWSAPGKIFNGDLQVSFTKKDYKYVHYDFKDIENGGERIGIIFHPL